MRVDGIGGDSKPNRVLAQATDPVSKNIRAQIANAQKQLQELAANKEMEPEEKMERRKEIQQKIMDLNAQLRQHEIELRHEKQQEKQSVAQKKQEPENAPKGKQAAGMSQGSMEAMISANRAVGQAEVQQNMVGTMKARANILKSEIEHSARGAAVERKQESVAEIEERISKVAKDQAQNLNRAGEELNETAKDVREEKKAEEKDRNKDTKLDMEGSVESKKTESDKVKKEENGNIEEEDAMGEKERIKMPLYRKVDVLL